jgi:hypothetical protein
MKNIKNKSFYYTFTRITKLINLFIYLFYVLFLFFIGVVIKFFIILNYKKIEIKIFKISYEIITEQILITN